MKIRVETAAGEYLVDLRHNCQSTHYHLDGSLKGGGEVSIEEIAPGLYSILEGSRSTTVRLRKLGCQLEAWINGRKLSLALSDPRDTVATSGEARTSGPREVHAVIPGKVVKLLVSVGDEVEAGTGVIVIEAMKMQNELRAPKTGCVKRINTAEGATVIAGEPLLEIE